MAFALSLLVACTAMFGLSFMLGAGIVWIDDRRVTANARNETVSMNAPPDVDIPGDMSARAFSPADHRGVA